MAEIKLSTETKGNILNIVAKEGNDEAENMTFRERMLVHNDIEGIIQPVIKVINNKKKYEFDVGGMKNLIQYCQGQRFGREELQGLLKGITEPVCHGKDFMLLSDDFILTPDMVFVDCRGNIRLLYKGGYGESFNGQIRNLAGFLMDFVDYADEQAVMLIYAFYMKTKSDNCTPELLRESIRSTGTKQSNVRESGPSVVEEGVFPERKNYKNYAEDYVLRERIGANREPEEEGRSKSPAELLRFTTKREKIIMMLVPGVMAAVMCASYVLFRNVQMFSGRKGRFVIFMEIILGLAATVCTELRIFRNAKEKCRSIDEEETEETILLFDSEDRTDTCALVSDEYETIVPTHFPFFIGKDKTHVDYVLNHSGISRYHLKIDRDEEGFLIADLNSTNGSFLNGERLQAHVPVRVRRGDEIKLGRSIYYLN